MSAAHGAELTHPTHRRRRRFSDRLTGVPCHRPFVALSRKSELSENGHSRLLTGDVGENGTERSFRDRLEVR